VRKDAFSELKYGTGVGDAAEGGRGCGGRWLGNLSPSIHFKNATIIDPDRHPSAVTDQNLLNNLRL
jgi:hypothetical protein